MARLALDVLVATKMEERFARSILMATQSEAELALRSASTRFQASEYFLAHWYSMQTISDLADMGCRVAGPYAVMLNAVGALARSIRNYVMAGGLHFPTRRPGRSNGPVIEMKPTLLTLQGICDEMLTALDEANGSLPYSTVERLAEKPSKLAFSINRDAKTVAEKFTEYRARLLTNRGLPDLLDGMFQPIPRVRPVRRPRTPRGSATQLDG